MINTNLSIKKLNLIIFLVVYLIFFIISLINFLIYNTHEYNKSEKIITGYNESFTQQITGRINSLISTSKYPLLLPDLSDLNSILTSNKPLSTDDYNYLKYICDMMLIHNDYINGAFIYKLNGDGLYSVRNVDSSDLYNPVEEDWFKDILESKSFTTIIPRMSCNSLFKTHLYNDDLFIGVARKIVDIDTQKVTGIALLTIPHSSLINLLKVNLTFNEQVISIYDLSNNLILSTSEDMDIKIPADKFNSCSSTPIIDSLSESDEKTYVAAYNKISNADFVLVNYIPKSEVYMLNKSYFISAVINLIFAFMLFFTIYIFLIKRIFNPLNSLIDNMNLNNVEKNLNNNFNYDKKDEIGILVDSYNRMKLKINDLINVNYKNRILQKELELKQLQLQINPHFIYNTLESIHMMAEINDDEETSTMAEYFGTIIRYSMNRHVNTVLLREEIEIINNYIYLQEIRFDQLFSIKNLISPDVLNCEIIKMIIQPLIEDCIYHGLSECENDGKIIIQGEKINDNLVLTISDNGTGIDDNTLKDINDYVNDKNNKFSGIGLKNVNKRIKLYYGEEFGLVIYSVYGKGTSLQLTLPYIVKN